MTFKYQRDYHAEVNGQLFSKFNEYTTREKKEPPNIKFYRICLVWDKCQYPSFL